VSDASLWWGLLFGAIGLGYFIYGRQQRKGMPLACGVGLMLFPYFISNGWAMLLVGIALMAVPWFLRF